MDDAVDSFMAFTGAPADVARRYLAFAENNPEQAVQLYFDSPDLASAAADDIPSQAPPIPTATRPPTHTIGREDASGVVHIDSDEDMDVDSDDDLARAAAVSRAADVEDDAAMARRMQEELYAGGDASGDVDADGVRAPIARRTETLVGGPDDDGGGYGHDYIGEQISQRMRARLRGGPSGQPGIFNQRSAASSRSIWDESSAEALRRQELSQSTGGASDASSKAARLAELFRPPFDIMNQLDWEKARDKGKEEMKWILVNIQDPSIFDCQSLNRDIWKDPGIKELVKENFIFMQYSKDDPRGAQYVNYYFPLKDSQAAYPHIAIVDPRTGEQVKIWSGPPVPKAGDFLMQLVEFLDRYSLDLSKTNPVARRKAEKPKTFDIDRLTEEEMLDLALQNSLNNGSTPPNIVDPDELTKSPVKGKGKEVEEGEPSADTANGSSSNAAFASISSTNPHIAPALGAPGTTRIQFRHPNGRVVRVFDANDSVRRLFEWLKAEPLEGKAGVAFDLKGMGKDLIEHLDDTIDQAGLKNGTVMVEFDE